MKSILKSMGFRNVALLFLQVLFFMGANAQTHTPRYQSMIPNSRGYYEYLPQGYNTETQTYPLIVFLHGIGELGDGGVDQLPLVLANGTPRTIKDGKFPVSFTVNGQTFKFIVISPQFLGWPSTPDVQGVIDYAVKNYRVNTSRIYLTGLSMGGGAVWDYAGASNATANGLAAIVPVCGVSGAIIERVTVLSNTLLPIWATHNLGDPTVPVTNTTGYIDQLTVLDAAINPFYLLNPIVKKTIFPVDGHDAWSTTYSLTFKENNMNIYEWMLQYQRGNAAPAPAPAPNKYPTANAGADQSITLPSNSVTLSGSGSDPDGSITNYSWTKLSGPSQYSINNANITNPTISNLVEGVYSFRLSVTDNSGAMSTDDVIVTVIAAPVTTPPVVSGTVPIPGKIETENYSNMFGVLNEKTTDVGGGLDVGWIELGDWLDYNVNVASSGNYTVNFRVATPYTGQQLQLKSSNGTVLTTVNIPQTGGFQNWQTVTATVALNAGTQTLRIYSSQNGWWNINWAEFVAVPAAAPAPPPPTSSTGIIPGRIEAETYSSMFGVATESTSDVNGGLDVGWIELGDWFEYNVNVQTSGTYTVNFRVATPYSGQQLQLKTSNGFVLTTVNIPQTGGFQTWSTVSATVNLNAGAQTIRVYSSQNGWWNINWLEFVNTQSVIPGYAPIPGKIEAESYTNMFGVIAESTTDVNGGYDLGWIELGDWFEYNVNVAVSGNYIVNFRVAAPGTGQQLQVKNGSGSVLATVDVPQTGGFQTWKTVSTSLYLFAGTQTIRIYSSQNGWWNINWFEFVSGSNATSDPATNANILLSGATASDNNALIPVQQFSIYPNPVKKTFALQIKNPYTGAMNVQVVNQTGAIVKQFKLAKTLPVSQLNLSVDELPAGNYFLKVQIGNWSETRKLIKLK